MNQSEFESLLSGARAFIVKFAEVLNTVRNWYERNAENIAEYISIFVDFGIWCSAVDKLANNQVVFTDNLDLDLAKIICNTSDIDSVIEKYYFENNEKQINYVIERCRNSEQVAEYINLFSQTISAYKIGHYHLACIGMFSLIDGVLADVSDMITSTNFKLRIQTIENKLSDKIELNDVDKRTLCIYDSLNITKDTIFGHSDFSQPETSGINRHCIVHGRTRKIYTKYDFLKILLCLDAIIYLSNMNVCTEEVNVDE